MVNLDYLYNPEAVKSRFNKNYFLDKKLSFQIIENGMILPHKKSDVSWFGLGGIIDGNGKFIKNSTVWQRDDKSYTPPPESIQYSSETVIYFNFFFPVWGHCITDNIRRLWFLKSDSFKKEFKNCPIVYIAYNRTNIESCPDFKRLLEILEVESDNLKEITQPTQFKRIILPDESFYSPFREIAGFTNEFREHIDQVRNFALKHSMPTSSKKFYFFHGRKGQFGEERLAEYFKSKGYETIDVTRQKLTFDEELNILINCESFAASTSSTSMNLLFLRDETETIIIPRLSFTSAISYESINQVHPLNIYYIDSTLSIFTNSEPAGRWFYLISKQLKKFFGDKWDSYEEEDFKTFLQYVKNYLGKGLSIYPKSKELYAPILADFMAQLKQREELIAAYNMPPHWEEFRSLMAYQTHVHKNGWGSWINEEQISNDATQQLDIQAIKINFPSHKVYYSVYYDDKEGWSEEIAAPEMAGTTGKRKPIKGLKIRLDEAGTNEFDILYRVHKFDGSWTAWAKNGEAIYSQGQKLNAIQIKLEPKT